MANDNDDALTTGALFFGGGAAGYAAGRWLFARRLDKHATPDAASSISPTAQGATAESTTARPSRPRPTPAASGPVTSPSQVDDSAGPVTSPSQVAPTMTPRDPYADAASASTAEPGVSRRFDPIFEKYRGTIPIEYLRALAMRESGMNPGERSGPADSRGGFPGWNKTRFRRGP